MKTIDWVRAALLILGIVLVTKGVARLRFPKYEVAVGGSREVSASDRATARPTVKKSTSSTVFAVVGLSTGALLISGIGWSIWRWDRWRLVAGREAKGGRD